MGEEDWNPSEVSFAGHAIAGSLAGLAEHVAIFPIDTLKTHVQCERCGTSSWNCAATLIRREGVLRLWRGVTATFVGCIPAHAAYFSVYEAMKVLVGANKEGHHPVGAAFSGASAAFSHDLFMTPLDTVKQRMQLGYYKSSFHCIKTILKEEGIKSLYRSFPTTVVMNLPYGCIMVATNESVKEVFNTKNNNYDFMVSMLAGSVAGSTAAALTNPLDVIKTRLQTHNLQPCPIANKNIDQNIPIFESNTAKHVVGTKLYSSGGMSSSSKGFGEPLIASLSQTSPILNKALYTTPRSLNWYSAVADTVQVILREDGYQGFLRGIGPRVLVHAPSVAISWTVYEGLKHFFNSNS